MCIFYPVVLHFLKFLEEQHPTEPVGLVLLAPAGSQPLSVGLTREYGELSKALYVKHALGVGLMMTFTC